MPAWVTANDPVIHGSVQNGLEQPVGLGRGDRAYAGIEQGLTPAAHLRLFDLGDRLGFEVRRDVAAQQIAIELHGLWPQIRPLSDPRGAVVREQHLTGLGIDPLAVEYLGLFTSEPDLSLDPPIN
jgi:hypothetical protein